jgi:hypothetical protein
MGVVKQVGQRDDDLVRVALGALDLEEALGAGAARLVDDDHRLLHQLVLDDQALDQPRHLVGTAARACGDDELDRLGGLPGEGRGTAERQRSGKHGAGVSPGAGAMGVGRG